MSTALRIRLAAAFLLAAAALCALGPAAPAASAKKGRRKILPDLKTTQVKLGGVSTPEHLVIEPDGHTEGFAVQIVVKNVGRGKAAPTKAELVGVFEHGKEVLGQAEIGHLKPGHSDKATVAIDNQFQKTGFMQVEAIANGIGPIPETTRRNNSLKTGHIAVIPQVWQVNEFDTVEKVPGMPIKETFAGTALEFRFAQYVPGDEAFEYLAFGGVNGRVSGSFYGACSVSGQGFTSHSPWDTYSGFRLPQQLTSYKGFIFASADEPWTATLNCGGSSLEDEKEKFQNLTTESQGSDYAPMSPSDQTLSGSTLYHEIEFFWEFTAKIAGLPPPPPPPPPPA